MGKQAIKVHNQRTAIWHLFPVERKPKTTLKCFAILEKGVYDDEGGWFLWDNINRNTCENFEVHHKYFSGDRYDDGEKKFDIIGSFFLTI